MQLVLLLSRFQVWFEKNARGTNREKTLNSLRFLISVIENYSAHMKKVQSHHRTDNLEIKSQVFITQSFGGSSS